MTDGSTRINYGTDKYGRVMGNDVTPWPDLFCPGCGVKGVYKVEESGEYYSAVFCVHCRHCYYLDTIECDPDKGYDWPVSDPAKLSTAIKEAGL